MSSTVSRCSGTSQRRFNRAVITLCICFVALANVQCARDGGESEADGPTLTIHVPGGDERALGPAGFRYFLVFLGLAEESDYSDNPEPRLLDHWEHTQDYKEWTLHVRDSLQWGDGVPVTAEDVKFSLELWTDTDVWYETRFFETITVLDSHTLRVTFKEPVVATIFAYTWLPMLPKHLLDTLDPAQFYSWPFWIQPVGNGPYRYVRHVAKTMTELEANPDYYGDAPKIPRVVLHYGGNALTELRSGNVDMIDDLTPLQAVALASDPRFRIYHNINYDGTAAIRWNHRNPLFSDVDVRRALTMSINRRELLRLLDYPDDVPIVDVPARARHYAQGVVPDPLPFDPERAARLFARAGWVDTDNDNILEKDGQEFRFTLSTQTTAEAVYVQDQFRRVGIRVEISTYPRSVLRERIQEHDFDAALLSPGWWGSHIRSESGTGYENAELRRILEAIWSTLDQKEADKLWRGVWEIVGADIPVTFLHPSVSFRAAHRRVRGIQNNQELIVEDLWIEGDEGVREY